MSGETSNALLRLHGMRVTAQRLAYDAPCLTAADGSRYEIDQAHVIYWGRCPESTIEPSEGNSPRGERSP